MENKRIVTGLWDCDYCGTKHINGQVKKCPNCGRPAGENVKYYLGDKDTQVEIHNPNIDDKMPEWKCNYCGSYNKYTRNTCINCGADKNRTKDYFGKTVNYKDEAFETDIFEDEEEAYSKKAESQEKNRDNYCDEYNQYEDEYKQNRISSYTPEGVRNRLFKKINYKPIVVLTFVVAIITLLLYLFLPHNTTIDVVDKSWSREIRIEHYVTVNENDWSVPTGGRVQYTRNEIHHYEEVLDHYETVTEQKSRQVLDGYKTVEHTRDLGNGNFEITTIQEPVYRTEYYTETHQEPVYRSEPIYRTKYYYEIERWLYARSVETNENSESPYWGEFILADNEREASRNEEYRLHYNWKDSVQYFSVSFDEWNNCSIGDTLNVKANKFGVVGLMK